MQRVDAGTESPSPDPADSIPRRRAVRWGWRRPVLGVAIVLSLIVAHDVAVPVDREIGTRSMVFAIEQYRRRVSPWIGNFVQCRFRPSCSAYGLAAVRKHGAVRGGAKAIARIVRCNPWTPMGTVDEP